MSEPLITIITPTTGSKTLHNLIDSIDAQGVPCIHMLLWDDKREDNCFWPDENGKIMKPEDFDNDHTFSIVLKGAAVQGVALGSSLRAVGLMAATTPYVAFADSDVEYEPDHLKSMLKTIGGKKWAYCFRKVLARNGDCIGVDRFESVGKNRYGYVLHDNSTLLFERRLGTSAAVLYRETKEYNDDRLMSEFLYRYGGEPGVNNKAGIKQICPDRLEQFFRDNCSKD